MRFELAIRSMSKKFGQSVRGFDVIESLYETFGFEKRFTTRFVV